MGRIEKQQKKKEKTRKEGNKEVRKASILAAGRLM
jgi:hypothetical protein